MCCGGLGMWKEELCKSTPDAGLAIACCRPKDRLSS